MPANKRCPLVNPLCPDDLCVLPAGHYEADKGSHLTGTMYGSGFVDDPGFDAADYVDEVSDVMFLAKPGTQDRTLIKLGWDRQDLLLKEGTVR